MTVQELIRALTDLDPEYNDCEIITVQHGEFDDVATVHISSQVTSTPGSAERKTSNIVVLESYQHQRKFQIQRRRPNMNFVKYAL
jgi:hypothetical protein